MTMPLESSSAIHLEVVIELLRAEGCTSASIFVDGPELVVDGCAPSYEAKKRIEGILRGMVGYNFRNSIRVYPD
jgi:hypothetical protein